jgi:putative copper export protein/methionine-rich copper-binding protein CopC
VLLLSIALGALLIGLNLFTSAATVRAHASYERSNPANNASLPSGQPPQQVQVWFAENIEPQFSELTVVNSTDGPVDVGDSHVPPGETNSLVITLKPGLPDGLYTVNFRNTSADDGHISKGGFNFTVGTAPEAALPQPANPAQPDTASTENLNFWTISLRWLNYLAAAILLGSLGFEILVWRRSTRRLVEPGGALAPFGAVYRLGLGQIRKLAWLGLAGLLVGWFGWVLNQAGSISNQSLGQLIGLSPAGQAPGPRALLEFLVGTRYGNVWLARLGIMFFLADVLVLIQPEKAVAAPKTAHSAQTEPENTAGPLENRSIPEEKQARPVNPALETDQVIAPAHSSVAAVSPQLSLENPVKAGEQTPNLAENHKWWWVALILSAGIMLTTSLTSHAASKEFITIFTVSFDWLHLLSTAVWIGGLVGLTFSLKVAIPSLQAGSGNRTLLLGSLIPAFSQVALIAVATLILTGVLNAAIQLTDIGQLFSTGYGLSLSVKVLLLLILLGLGAYNLLVVSKRMDKFANSKPTSGKGAGSKAAGILGLKFRRLVLLEIGLAVLAFLAAAFLTSNPPPRSLTPPGLSVAPQPLEQNVKLAGDVAPIVVSFDQLAGVDGQVGRQDRVGQ